MDWSLFWVYLLQGCITIFVLMFLLSLAGDLIAGSITAAIRRETQPKKAQTLFSSSHE